MSNNQIIVLLLLACVILSGCVSEKKEVKMYQVGIITNIEAFSGVVDGFKSKMAELGYIEGENIVYDFQVPQAGSEEEQQLFNRFIENKVDLILAFPTEPAFAAKEATEGTEIPIIFAIAGTENSELIESVREPGGYITGIRYPGPYLVVKRFEFLLELAPHIKRLYVPYNPDYPNCPPAIEELRPVASSKNVTLVEAHINSVEEIQNALQELEESDDIGIDAIQILPEAITQTPDGWGAISSFADEHGLPLVGSMLFSADIGGVFSYCVEFFEIGELAAPLADKILKGIPAGTIPVVTPEAHLRVNYKKAHELGLTVPEGLLARADEIIR